MRRIVLIALACTALALLVAGQGSGCSQVGKAARASAPPHFVQWHSRSVRRAAQQVETYKPRFEPLVVKDKSMSVTPFFSPEYDTQIMVDMANNAVSTIDIGNPSFKVRLALLACVSPGVLAALCFLCQAQSRLACGPALRACLCGAR